MAVGIGAAMQADDILVPQVVYGYFPANGDGNELVIWTDESRVEERCRFRYPRQKVEPHLCIADFFRPIDGDEVGFHDASALWGVRSSYTIGSVLRVRGSGSGLRSIMRIGRGGERGRGGSRCPRGQGLAGQQSISSGCFYR